METKFLTSTNFEILSELKDSLNKFQQFDWVIAFATFSGYEYIQKDFEKFLNKGGVSRAVFDII